MGAIAECGRLNTSVHLNRAVPDAAIVFHSAEKTLRI